MALRQWHGGLRRRAGSAAGGRVIARGAGSRTVGGLTATWVRRPALFVRVGRPDFVLGVGDMHMRMTSTAAGRPSRAAVAEARRGPVDEEVPALRGLCTNNTFASSSA